MTSFARTLLLAALGAFLAFFATSAQAGVATAGAVLLDPFDPVPEIQFYHYGGYGCADACGYDRCGDGCYRHHHHYRCDDGCRRARCDDDCRPSRCEDRCGDFHRADYTTPCTSGHCYDAEHWEHRWRDGDHVGQDWMDRGHRERVLPEGGHPEGWYGHDSDWHDDSDDHGDGPPAGAPH